MFSLFRKKQKVSSRELASDLVDMFESVYQSCINMKPTSVRLTDENYKRQSLAFVYSIGNLAIQRSSFDVNTKHVLSVRFIEIMSESHKLFIDEFESTLFLHKSWTEFLPTLDMNGNGVFPCFFIQFIMKTGADIEDASEIASMTGINMSAMGAIAATVTFLNAIAQKITVTR